MFTLIIVQVQNSIYMYLSTCMSCTYVAYLVMAVRESTEILPKLFQPLGEGKYQMGPEHVCLDSRYCAKGIAYLVHLQSGYLGSSEYLCIISKN